MTDTSGANPLTRMTSPGSARSGETTGWAHDEGVGHCAFVDDGNRRWNRVLPCAWVPTQPMASGRHSTPIG
jgi:hypothetical protein